MNGECTSSNTGKTLCETNSRSFVCLEMGDQWRFVKMRGKGVLSATSKRPRTLLNTPETAVSSWLKREDGTTKGKVKRRSFRKSGCFRPAHIAPRSWADAIELFDVVRFCELSARSKLPPSGATDLGIETMGFCKVLWGSDRGTSILKKSDEPLRTRA